MTSLVYTTAVCLSLLVRVGAGMVFAALRCDCCPHEDDRDVDGWLR